jgi:malonyl-CoA decarboxylase
MASRRFLDRVRRRGARRTPGRVALDVAPGLPERDAERVREVIAELLCLHDTMTKRAEAAVVADAYVSLNDDGRRNFLDLLTRDFWTDQAKVDGAIGELTRATDRRASERRLRAVLTPPADTLLHLFTGLDGGVKFLVDLRGDVLRLGPQNRADLDEELMAHIGTLFDVGLLSLRRITWDAPAALLEKLAEYEAVHAISTWEDLKHRLESDRRCYAFFHPAMPDEPLVFVEIALTAEIPAELPPLLDMRVREVDLDAVNTAVFYSISNCQPGLAGVNLGTALIKQVVEALRHDLPQLQRFVTLSPIPGFRSWLAGELRDGAPRLNARERELLPAGPDRVLARLDDADWAVDEAVRPALLALCARYLTSPVEGRVVDPVANFHLSNGARVERVNWLADPSPRARTQSFALMANYLYEPNRIAERAEGYAAQGVVTTSSAVRELLAS